MKMHKVNKVSFLPFKYFCVRMKHIQYKMIDKKLKGIPHS